ncbi:MAG: AMP-binding protein [Actinomycetota bacterium]|nr:AMP-binding protein [Acidimicrobiia bacterium]MDQ3294541.1 AMP-binding protein [Actinomycetota bacterium]
MATDVLALHAAATPDKAAIIDGDAVTTYAELNARVNRLANGLAALGAARGERAVWCGPNSASVLAFLHAARKIGLVAVPAAYRFTAEELQYVVDNSDATLVVVDAEHAEKVAAVRDQLPEVAEVVVFGGEPFDGARRWDDVVGLGGDDEPAAAGESSGATMIYTSGTTGKPKGALRTTTDAELTATLLQLLRLQPGNEVHITTGPLYHSGPLAWASLTHALGGTVVLLRHFDAERWVDLVREHRVTNTFTAPTQLKRIVALPDEVLARADLSSMRSLVANAAPVPYALKQEIVAKLGDHFLFEVYGSTELGVDAVLPPEDQLRKPGSCGKPYGSVQVKIVGDDGSEQPVGEPGELFVSTTAALDGYHRTTEQVTDLDGWKSVGDVGYLDEEGYLYICDRKKDMIISGGVNIYPAEIEAVLHAHPDVMDAAVFGVPSDEWGESVHAVVQPRDGHEIDLDALGAYATEHLAGFKRPRSWEVRESLPRTESGKLLKRVLRDEHWQGRHKV